MRLHHRHGQSIERGFLGKMLQLALPAPDIVDAAVDEKAPPAIALPALMLQVPAAWTPD